VYQSAIGPRGCYGQQGLDGAIVRAGALVHELSLAQDMITTLTRLAVEHRATRVATVHLKLGEFTHVDPETLTFAFEVACRGTPLEGCRLDIVRLPTRLRCPACSWEGSATPEEYVCPTCGHLGFTVLQGRELQLDSMDIAD
jgi:hydrogenase nickel incorporation protein HypA/HybF